MSVSDVFSQVSEKVETQLKDIEPSPPADDNDN